MRKRLQQFLSMILVFAMILAMVPPMQTSASKNKSACYGSDYRKWNQGQSAYSEVREVGCFIVAQAKMLYEANVNREAGFNPDFWYEWLWAKGYLSNPPTSLYMVNAAGPAVYAADRGKQMEYLGYWNADDDQLWFNIRAGYYTIVNVGGHFVMIDNATSLRTGQLYIYDSYNRPTGAGTDWPIYNQFTTWNDSPCRLSKYGTRKGGHVYKNMAATVVTPAAPASVSLGSENLGIGDALNVSWTASAGADQYQVQLICSENSAYNQSQTVGGTGASFAISAAGTYQVRVSASNSAGTSGASSSGRAIVHPNVTVTYTDWDGSVIGQPQSVRYAGNAAQPSAPSREGYTFQSWSSDGKNVRSDTVIEARYSINTYNVRFVDEEGNAIGNVQKVEYGSAAAEPTDIPTPSGFVFAGWSTDEYKNVKKSMTVEAVYVWENPDLPIIAEISSAVRNPEATGYDVTVNITNFPNDFTKGKLVAALKTKEGKMVTSETRSISVPSSGEAEETFTILYSGLVSTVEVSMMGIVDDETTGTPKSEVVSKAIDVGNEWSDWGETIMEGDDIVQESRPEYRYKDRKIIKSVTTPAAPAGYSLTGSQKTGMYTDWGAWSGYSKTVAYGNTLTDVQTTTGYRYYAFVCSNCGARDPYSGACSNCGGNGMYWQEDWGTVNNVINFRYYAP